MAITVTLGEGKTQEEKIFPKLIKLSYCDSIVEVFNHPDEEGKYIGIHRYGETQGVICMDFTVDEHCIDYNEPITLQNK